ncbi:hypothetical protein BFW38_01740 [Terasakiispira papahanaumokuakeensis]|uniref:PilZ domain-containing protein n=1 Tax=Terasakiispira papahanaumokuakeensis TaxID=197479 RepID=A0A1E2V648_9GAMM|nr:flagellar brake protein [Terasakiispira papahanaumokuakeensis]ODC02454.1 hypothetical protein BFW38_01740 [Terasakiispira papahanaumokuakeensis]
MPSGYDDDTLITRSSEIATVLRALQRQHSSLSLHFRGQGNQTYLTMILDVDPERQLFTLDELNPPSGHPKAVAGDTFSIRGSDNGVAVFFSGCSVIEVEEAQDGFLYTVRFPNALTHNQRREAFRAHVFRSLEIAVELNASTREAALQSYMQDLSSTGCKLVFDQIIQPPFHEMEVFERCLIHLPEHEVPLQLAMEARHATYDEQKGRTECGFRFLNVDGKTQQDIDRYVIYLQREARRLALR